MFSSSLNFMQHCLGGPGRRRREVFGRRGGSNSDAGSKVGFRKTWEFLKDHLIGFPLGKEGQHDPERHPGALQRGLTTADGGIPDDQI